MINIKIDKSNKCNGEYSLYISFPYNQNIVNIMREQTIRYYNPNTKEWELPIKSFDKLKEQLKDYQINMSITDENKFKQFFTQKEYTYIPNDYKFKMKPFSHQIEGIEYGLKYDRFLLGDEQRTWKNNASYKFSLY